MTLLQRVADLLAKEAAYERAKRVRCPTCGADVGAPCVSLRSGRRVERDEPHFYRAGTPEPAQWCDCCERRIEGEAHIGPDAMVCDDCYRALVGTPEPARLDPERPRALGLGRADVPEPADTP